MLAKILPFTFSFYEKVLWPQHLLLTFVHQYKGWLLLYQAAAVSSYYEWWELPHHEEEALLQSYLHMLEQNAQFLKSQFLAFC